MDLIAHFNQGRVPHDRMIRHPETYVLIHFGLNTYTDKEWGYGDEDPALFDPVDFDADSIVQAVKTGGFEGMILVCKHHDGFCLWPSKTTQHNISKSPFRNGKGDLVREFSDAARRAGLAMGFYVSPWDRNHPAYGTEEYVRVYQEQLREIYTNYGPAFEAWFDGANGGDGYYGGARETRTVPRGTYYTWRETWGIVRSLQKDAAIFSDVGPDLRWVGNELGYARKDCYASSTPGLHATALPGDQPGPGFCSSAELDCGNVDGSYYLPPECDVPLRPGWFYHAREDEMLRSVQELVRIYMASVGCGAYFNLGISPNRQGVLHPNDVKRLQEFSVARKQLFQKNVLPRTEVKIASGSAAEGSFGSVKKLLNLVELREDLSRGELVTEYSLKLYAGNALVHSESGSAVGRRRLRHFSTVEADRWELTAVSRSGEDLTLSFAAFEAPEELFADGRRAAEATDRKDYLKLENISASGRGMEVELPAEMVVKGFIFVPFDFPRGLPERYLLEGRNSQGEWHEICRGEFSNIRANPIAQVVQWENAVQCSALRLTAEKVAARHEKILFREFGILIAE